MATQTDTAVQFQASHRFARISPRKVNLVLAMIRGKNVSEALNILRFAPQRAAFLTSKVLKSCIANAEHITTLPGSTSANVDIDNLFVKRAVANAGPTIKRWHPVGMGRAFPIKKRTCHICLSLEEAPEGDVPKKKVRRKAAAKSAGGSKKTGKKKAAKA